MHGLSLKSTIKTSEMIRKVGLEADSILRSVTLLQGFATRSLQFEIFLIAIILLSTSEASIMFYIAKKLLVALNWKMGLLHIFQVRLAEI